GDWAGNEAGVRRRGARPGRVCGVDENDEESALRRKRHRSGDVRRDCAAADGRGLAGLLRSSAPRSQGKPDDCFEKPITWHNWGGKSLKLIRPVSKRDQVVAAFKDAILRGEIQPGDAIVESRVAQQLGAGVPLVREALIELEHRGYVQTAPTR